MFFGDRNDNAAKKGIFLMAIIVSKDLVSKGNCNCDCNGKDERRISLEVSLQKLCFNCNTFFMTSRLNKHRGIGLERTFKHFGSSSIQRCSEVPLIS